MKFHEQKHIDPMECWPFTLGIRERRAGDPKDPKRWMGNSRQQRAWEDGWDLADEMERLGSK